VDEFPDVTFYVLNEPALSAPPPDEIGIWQELAHLRTENYAWRECVQAIVHDVQVHGTTSQALKDAIQQRIVSLGGRVAQSHHRRRLTGADHE
jgi:hypothetical protein